MKIRIDSFYTDSKSSDYSFISSQKRFQTIFENVKIEDISILDYGCGPGNLCQWFKDEKRIPKLYHGYDIREETIQYAKEKHSDWMFTSETSTFASYDMILLIGTISYAFSQDIALCKDFYLKEIQKVKFHLRENGKIWITARKYGKERGANNKKLMITYTEEELQNVFKPNSLIDLFEHEWLLTIC